MNSRILLLIKKLEDSVNSDEFLYDCQDVVEELISVEDGQDAIEPILSLFEKHEEADFGSPGPLVHYLEKFYKKGYESKLISSLRRKPTAHTLWMFNRILNSLEGDEKTNALNFLDELIESGQMSSEVLEEALNFRSLH